MVATTVLPEPTSPSNSRDMGLGFSRSFKICQTAFFCPSVSLKGKVAVNFCMKARFKGMAKAFFWSSFFLSIKIQQASVKSSSKENLSRAFCAKFMESGK